MKNKVTQYIKSAGDTQLLLKLEGDKNYPYLFKVFIISNSK
jgi:hypothetical protein